MNNKLIKVLFYKNTFNKDGHKMRTAFEREISNGTNTYYIWRSAGKPDMLYPRAENDRYILYIEVNGYLVSLRMTDFELIYRCGSKPAMEKLYGGDEKKQPLFKNIDEFGGLDELNAARERETEEIECCGRDPIRQTDYIQSFLDGHLNCYLEAKENGGATFPDFIGALILDDLDRCVELSAIYKSQKQKEHEEHVARNETEEKAFCEERNQETEQKISEAVQIIRNGGVLKNEKISFYKSKSEVSSCSMVNHLMRLYKVNVPLRTQGWINNNLVSVVIANGECDSLNYLRSKYGKCSQRFFQCMHDLIHNVLLQGDDDLL